MRAAAISGTENYTDEAPELLQRYESISFADAHLHVMHLIPSAPCRILDIGAGTGRDAAGLVALGHSVLAVEPTEELRLGAMLLHPSPMIEWLDDSLPKLATVRARQEEFDLVMLTAVWMHLDEAQRQLAMPNVSALVRNGGAMIMSLRAWASPAGATYVRSVGRRNNSLSAALKAPLRPEPGGGGFLAATRRQLDPSGVPKSIRKHAINGRFRPFAEPLSKR
jgi:SAM-dependent methyltransferase